MKRMKRVVATVLIAAMAVTGGLAVTSRNTVAAEHPKDIVGVWEVDADAPYRPHLFTFHEDGTMTTTNPTNVQENPTLPHGGTNDSLGMGVWRVEKQGDTRFIVGTFEQLNAFADNHQPTDKLSVSFRVELANDGNSFDGPASAKVGSDVFPSHVSGNRITIDEPAVNALP